MTVPTNDLFVNALILPSAVSGGENGSTFDAGIEASEPTLITSTEQSVWYVWTCPTTGWYKWTVPVVGHDYHGVFGSDFSNIGLAIFPDGTLTQMTVANALATDNAQLNPLALDSDAVVAAFLTAGNKYYIKVSSSRTGSTLNSNTVDFQLNWEKFTPPANDDFSGALDLGSLPASEPGTTFDATFQVGSESENNADSFYDREQSVWFKFTAPATGRYRIKIPVSTLDGVGHSLQPNGAFMWMQISSGTTLGTFQAGEIAEKFIVFTSEDGNNKVGVDVDLVASTVYYIRLYCPYASKHTVGGGAFNQWAYDFTLEVEQWSPPANDNFANAELMSTTVPNTKAGTTYDSTEESGEPSVPWGFEQSVWYKFTPPSNNKYRFRIKLADVDYHGDRNSGFGQVTMSMKAATTLADHTTANVIGGFYSGPVETFSGWLNKTNAAIVADLVSGTQYNLKVNSDGGSSTRRDNEDTVDFIVDYQIVTAPANDNFASAQSISGSSGSTGFSCLGATSQHASSEPHSFYWNGGPGDPVGDSVWFTWTAPASGYYTFTVEAAELSQGSYDIAVYTGSALNALTRINSAWGGTHPNSVAPRMMKTKVGINATNGTTYKIQVVSWGNIAGDTATLSWATLTTPVGDSAAAAVTAPISGRQNNYGHTAADPPPNFATLGAAHDYWWYNSGKASKTKWYKYTATQDTRIQISAHQYDDDDPNTQIFKQMDDWGIIAYKGANYASLTVAQAVDKDTSTLENVVMFPNGTTTYQSTTYNDYLTTDLGNPIPVVDVAAGESLWICVFGSYDDDINGDGTWPAEDYHASEIDFDLTIAYEKPLNDDQSSASVYGGPNYEYYLLKDDYWGGAVFVARYAGMMKGTTFGATTQPSEPAHGGYGPTRSVWYTGALWDDGQYKFWVESPEDCVLSIYQGFQATPLASLVSLDEDDDSGAGNFPECVVTNNTGGPISIWVAVDSKVPTNFTLKWEKINTHPNPPANDHFANAIDLGNSAKVVRGTTVGASAEYFEVSTAYDSSGPSDSVWYKWTAPATKPVRIDGRVLSNNWDGWVIVDVFTGPDKDHLTVVTDGNEGGIFYGPLFPSQTNDPVFLDAVSGTVYWIRVSTEKGSSEEFELWVDTDVIYLKLTPSAIEDQPNRDQGTVYLKLLPSGTEAQKSPTSDSGTVNLKLLPITTFEDLTNSEFAEIPLRFTVSGSDAEGYAPVDSAVIPLTFYISAEEDHTHLCFAGEGNPELRFYGDPYLRFETDPLSPDLRWFSHLHKGAQYC